MDTRIIEYILELAEQKSISKAAEKLFISQPALSQQLKKLEEEIGQPLFYHENKELHLTDAGRIYVNNGQAILHVKQETMNNLRLMRTNNQASLRLFYTSSDVSETLQLYERSHPKINFETTKCNLDAALSGLSNGDCDLALFPSISLKHSLIDFIPLRQDTMYLVIPKDHPANQVNEAFKENYDLIKGNTFFLHRPGTLSRRMEEELLHTFEIVPDQIYEVQNFESELNAIKKGFGNGFVPNFFLQENDCYESYPLSKPFYMYLVLGIPKNTILSESMMELVYLLLEHYDTELS